MLLPACEVALVEAMHHPLLADGKMHMVVVAIVRVVGEGQENKDVLIREVRGIDR